MRFYEIFKNIVSEANRGMIGQVLDHQAGKGDIFIDAQGLEYRAVQNYKFPLENTEPKYTPEDDYPVVDKFEDEFESVLKTNSNSVVWASGKPSNAGFAALIIELQGPAGRKYFGKYFRNKDASGHLFWSVSNFIKEVTAAGFKLEHKQNDQKKGASSAASLYPVYLGITDMIIPIADVAATIANAITKSDPTRVPEEERAAVVDLIANIGKGAVECNPKLKSNYEVQLGETAAPIALNQRFGVTGAYDVAQEKLLDVLEPGLTWQGLDRVFFPSSVSEELVDSEMITQAGTRIGISSKDKKGGASASLSSINSTIKNQLPQIVKRIPNFETEYQEYLEYLKIIRNSKGHNMCLNLAAHMGMVSQDVANTLAEIVRTKPGDVDALRAADGNGKFYSMCINYPGYKPSNLAHSMYQPAYHMTASLSRIVCAEMNKDQQKISRFFSSVLESSNMVQVKTDFNLSGSQGGYRSFNVIYPPIFDGMILFDPGPYYYATAKPSILCFKFLPGKKPRS